MKHKRKGMSRKLFIVLTITLVVVGLAGYFIFKQIEHYALENTLPNFDYWQNHKSDQLPVSVNLIHGGSPYKGKNAITPHTGAHIEFGDDYKTWPRGGNAPQNYPPIYAVADGFIDTVENTFKVLKNDRYGIRLAIAKDVDFDYSIEPFVKEPSTDFYKKFILVKEGQHVKKGQVIAYMYIPPISVSTHIHFDLRRGSQFMAPAIFDKQTVEQFYIHWGSYGRDGGGPNRQGVSIPACMGYRLTAAENPFGTGSTDCLN